MFPFIVNHQIKRYLPSRIAIEALEKSDIETIIITSSQIIAKNEL